MTRVLVVENSSKWQMMHRTRLEYILGEGSVDVVGNYNDAISMLNRDYAAYVLDVQFPKCQGEKPQLLGVRLAQEIGRRIGSYDKIAMVSSGGHMLVEARMLGITKIYNKTVQYPENLIQDLQHLFK